MQGHTSWRYASVPVVLSAQVIMSPSLPPGGKTSRASRDV